MAPRLASQRRSHRNRSRNVRRLHVEPLEQRFLLATLTVNTNSGSEAVDNELSLAEAILIAAGTSGACMTDAERGQIDGASFDHAIPGPFCAYNPFEEERWQTSGGVGGGAQDFIVFATNVSTISPTAQLPDVGCLDHIDGLEGRSSKVQLHGGSAGDASGLVLWCDSNSFIWIKNLQITRFQRDGVLSEAPHSLFQGLELFNNDGSGLHLFHVGDSQIGGLEADQRNVIYDNDLDGILLEGSGDNRIENNLIGLKPNGDDDLGNRGHGISMFGVAGLGGPQGNNSIGGDDPGLGNVISGNAGFGAVLFNGWAGANRVTNNTIGLNASQSSKRANGSGGVYIAGGSFNNQVLANVIAGNNGHGVTVEHNGGAGGANNLVRNNFIGTNYALDANLGNAADGVLVQGATQTTVDVNLIQGNAGAGVHVTDMTGATVDSVITSNSIAQNAGAGILVEGTTSTRNNIEKNGINYNGGLGIDLSPTGINPNDANDSDTGANNGQNFPMLTKAYPSGSDLVVEGNLHSTASTSFRIQFFHSGACDPSGNGEGERFVGDFVQATDGIGNLSFTTPFATTVPTGQFVTATATNVATGDTSEFSACQSVIPSAGAGLTLTWMGGNFDEWSDPKNWQDNLGNDAVPLGGERLVFPANPFDLTPINDLLNLSFESVTILGTGYNISGNSITVGTVSTAEQTVNTLTLGVRPGAFYSVADKAQLTLRGVTAGAGSVGLLKQGGGELVIDAFHTYAGTTFIDQGTVTMAAGGRIPDASSVQISAGAILDLNGFSETVGSLGGGGNVQLGGGALDVGLNGESTTYSGVITGIGAFDKSGAGTLTLSGPNNYDGPTRIKLGNIQLGANNGIPNSSELTIEAGASLLLGSFSDTVGSLDGGGSVSGNGTLTAGGNGTSTTFTGNIGGFGAFTKTGAGTMNVSGSLGMNSNNINGGSLRFLAHGVLGGGPVRITDGTLDLNGFNQTVGNELSMNGGVIETRAGTLTLATNVTVGTNSSSLAEIRGNLSLGGATRTVNAQGPLKIFAAISDGGGSAGLTKTGGGLLSLDGDKNYTGATNVQAGTLNLRGNIASSAVTVSAGSLLETFLEHTTGALTLAGGTVQPGFTDRLNTQSLLLNSGTLGLDFESAAAFGYDDLSVTGGVTLNGNIALALALEFNPQDGVDVFRIIKNDGSDTTVLNGTSARFVYEGNLLVEGEIFQVTTGAFSQFFEIRYGLNAADNDVRLIAVAVDFGDAPSPYPTTLAQNGARHVNVGPRLGANRDGENNGQPNAAATGDDTAGAPDDEDGVVFGANLVVGQTGKVTVTASAAGQLNAWIDFNNNGSWADAGEQIFTNRSLAAGANSLTFAIPATATVGVNRPARFRLNSTGGLSFTGLAIDGEVEDHLVNFQLPINDRIGIHREYHFYQDVNGNGVWNGNAGGDRLNSFGAAGDIPVIGDWNGDGFDEIGVKRGNQYYLDLNGNGIWNGPAGGDLLLTFGNPSDVPLVGDWDGDGDDQIGVQRGNQFYLDRNSNGVWNGAAGGDLLYTFGNSGDTPLAGDWDGDGDDQIGIHRGSQFFLDRNSNGVWNAAAGGDRLYNFGATGDVPIVGDWNANGTDKIGVQRGNQFYRDNNGNGIWNGPAGGDLLHNFGNPGDRPLDGKWRPGSPLLAAGGVATSSSDDAVRLTRDALAPIQQQALVLWANTGLTLTQGQSLAAVQFQIADLPGAQLGLSLGGTIVLDADAAGYGWFIDPTPADNLEFETGSPSGMDLLSAVLHELGHELGFDHDDDFDAMIETLAAGTRHLLQ